MSLTEGADCFLFVWSFPSFHPTCMASTWNISAMFEHNLFREIHQFRAKCNLTIVNYDWTLHYRSPFIHQLFNRRLFVSWSSSFDWILLKIGWTFQCLCQRILRQMHLKYKNSSFSFPAESKLSMLWCSVVASLSFSFFFLFANPFHGTANWGVI